MCQFTSILKADGFEGKDSLRLCHSRKHFNPPSHSKRRTNPRIYQNIFGFQCFGFMSGYVSAELNLAVSLVIFSCDRPGMDTALSYCVLIFVCLCLSLSVFVCLCLSLPVVVCRCLSLSSSITKSQFAKRACVWGYASSWLYLYQLEGGRRDLMHINWSPQAGLLRDRVRSHI